MNKKEFKNRIFELELQQNDNEVKVKELTEELTAKDFVIKKLSNMYESQLKVQDSKIRRLNLIIDYLEVKLNITVKDK